MLVSETPPETRGDQMHQLRQAQRLGLLLTGHNCHVYERAVGIVDDPRFKCQVCHTERPARGHAQLAQWFGQNFAVSILEAA